MTQFWCCCLDKRIVSCLKSIKHPPLTGDPPIPGNSDAAARLSLLQNRLCSGHLEFQTGFSTSRRSFQATQPQNLRAHRGNNASLPERGCGRHWKEGQRPYGNLPKKLSRHTLCSSGVQGTERAALWGECRSTRSRQADEHSSWLSVHSEKARVRRT